MKRRECVLLVLLLFLSILLIACGTSSKVEPDSIISTLLIPEKTAPTIPPKTAVFETEIPSLIENDRPTDHLSQMRSQLSGIPLNEFFEISIKGITLRNPENVVAMGLTDAYQIEDVTLTDISDSYQMETLDIVGLILEILEKYDRNSLSSKDQISWDIYKWYLEDILAERDFMYHNYPATYFPVTAVNEDLIQFFTDIHPVRDFQDARDFVTRLGLVENKINQLIEGLKSRESKGITPPQFAIQWSIYGSLGSLINQSAKETPFYKSLESKFLPLSSGTPEERKQLLQEAEKVIELEILPAYRDLHTFLSGMQTYTREDSGIWRLPDGEVYYKYILRHFTTTDQTADQIHQLGLAELERIHLEMRSAFEKLGYASDLTIVEAYDRVAQDGGHVAGDAVLQAYETLISEAVNNLDSAFDIRPNADVIVIPDEFGDFYVHPAMDGSRPGAFYAGVGGSGKEYYAMPTLAYHETVPGHHLQIAIAQELENLPSFRRGLSFSAFAEGWALYAENLAAELGWYDEDPYGYLGMLQGQAFRAARLVVDTGLHAEGWTFDQAQDFFRENTGFDATDNVPPQYQIARYLVWPGQSTSYYVGFMKIMALRQHAQDILGKQFDLKEFHNVVLSNGSVPLEILEKIVDGYISENQG